MGNIEVYAPRDNFLDIRLSCALWLYGLSVELEAFSCFLLLGFLTFSENALGDSVVWAPELESGLFLFDEHDISLLRAHLMFFLFWGDHIFLLCARQCVTWAPVLGSRQQPGQICAFFV